MCSFQSLKSGHLTTQDIPSGHLTNQDIPSGHLTNQDTFLSIYTSYSVLILCVFSAASLLNINGRIFTVSFDDTFEDPPIDIITRLLVGGRLCDHLNDDGNL